MATTTRKPTKAQIEKMTPKERYELCKKEMFEMEAHDGAGEWSVPFDPMGEDNIA